MMLSSTSLLLASQGAGAVASGVGSYSQMQSLRAQGGYEYAIARRNATQATQEAQDARERGQDASNARLQAARALAGRQRAAMGASGVDPDSGSALDVVSDTVAIGAQEASDLRRSALREAFGHEMDASNLLATGRGARNALRNEARSTAATAGLRGSRDLLRAAYTWQEDPRLFERRPEVRPPAGKTMSDPSNR